jgi:hypothetical protein
MNVQDPRQVPAGGWGAADGEDAHATFGLALGRKTQRFEIHAVFVPTTKRLNLEFGRIDPKVPPELVRSIQNGRLRENRRCAARQNSREQNSNKRREESRRASFHGCLFGLRFPLASGEDSTYWAICSRLSNITSCGAEIVDTPADQIDPPHNRKVSRIEAPPAEVTATAEDCGDLPPISGPDLNGP